MTTKADVVLYDKPLIDNLHAATSVPDPWDGTHYGACVVCEWRGPKHEVEWMGFRDAIDHVVLILKLSESHGQGS